MFKCMHMPTLYLYLRDKDYQRIQMAMAILKNRAKRIEEEGGKPSPYLTVRVKDMRKFIIGSTLDKVSEIIEGEQIAQELVGLEDMEVR